MLMKCREMNLSNGYLQKYVPTDDNYFNRNQTNETHARETVEVANFRQWWKREFEGLQSIKMFMISKKSEFFKAKHKFYPLFLFLSLPTFPNINYHILTLLLTTSWSLSHLGISCASIHHKL